MLVLRGSVLLLLYDNEFAMAHSEYFDAST